MALTLHLKTRYRPIATPHGPLPAGIRRSSWRVRVSITDTSLDAPFALKSSEPSGLTTMPHGRRPTGILATILRVVVSKITT